MRRLDLSFNFCVTNKMVAMVNDGKMYAFKSSCKEL